MKSEDKEKNDNSHILDNALLTYLKNCDKGIKREGRVEVNLMNKSFLIINNESVN